MVFYVLCHFFVFQCVLLVISSSSALFFALIYIFSSSVITPFPVHVCPIISSLSVYFSACALLSYLTGILHVPQPPPALMALLPEETYCCFYGGVQVHAPNRSK